MVIWHQLLGTGVASLPRGVAFGGFNFRDLSWTGQQLQLTCELLVNQHASSNPPETKKARLCAQGHPLDVAIISPPSFGITPGGRRICHFGFPPINGAGCCFLQRNGFSVDQVLCTELQDGEICLATAENAACSIE